MYLVVMMECLCVGDETILEGEGASKQEVQRVFDGFKPFVTRQSDYFKILPNIEKKKKKIQKVRHSATCPNVQYLTRFEKQTIQ